MGISYRALFEGVSLTTVILAPGAFEVRGGIAPPALLSCDCHKDWKWQECQAKSPRLNCMRTRCTSEHLAPPEVGGYVEAAKLQKALQIIASYRKNIKRV